MEKNSIGTNAGNIWQYLSVNGDVKLSDLKKILKLDVKDIYLALGWLARENKIHFFHLEKELAVCLVD